MGDVLMEDGPFCPPCEIGEIPGPSVIDPYSAHQFSTFSPQCRPDADLWARFDGLDGVN